MGLLGFLKPNGAKIIYFLFLLVVAPFPYFIFSETLGQYEINWIWGFPPLVSLIYDYLPTSLQELNIGIFEINKVKTTFYWIPTYAFFIFLFSCIINLVRDKIKDRYGITTFRGLLYRKIEMREIKPKDLIEQSKKIKEKSKKEAKKEEKAKEEVKKGGEVEEKEEVKPEVELEEMDEEKIKEMASLIREEETFLKKQKKELQKFLDETNIKKLKSMGVDVKENRILCSGCKRWIKLPKGKPMKLIEKYGFDIIWEYKCPDCKGKK